MEVRKKAKDIWLNGKFQTGNIIKYTIKVVYTTGIVTLTLKILGVI